MAGINLDATEQQYQQTIQALQTTTDPAAAQVALDKANALKAELDYYTKVQPDPGLNAAKIAGIQARIANGQAQIDVATKRLGISQQNADTAAGRAAEGARHDKATEGIGQQNADTAGRRADASMVEANARALTAQAQQAVSENGSWYQQQMAALGSGKLQTQQERNQIMAEIADRRAQTQVLIDQANNAQKEVQSIRDTAAKLTADSAANYREEQGKLPSAAYVSGAQGVLGGTSQAGASALMQGRDTPAKAAQQPFDAYTFALHALKEQSPMAAAAVGSPTPNPAPAAPPFAANTAMAYSPDASGPPPSYGPNNSPVGPPPMPVHDAGMGNR